MSGGANVVGRVADEADCSLRAAKLTCQLDTVTKDIFAFLPRVAERSEIEELADAPALQLEPADLLKVPSHHADKLSAPAQFRQQLWNCRAELYFHFVGILCDFGPHDLPRLRQARLEVERQLTVMPECGTQNTGIGVAMHRHAIDAPLASVDFTQRGVEGVVMHASARVGQSAVNVEQVSVEVEEVKVPIGHRFQCSGDRAK